MTDATAQPHESDQTPTPPQTWRQRVASALPIGMALTLIAGVWVAGAVWSFEEQTRFADSLGFDLPELLPLVLDGMAVAMAAVAWAASLDARPAVLARLGTGVAIAASSASNATAAWERSAADVVTVVVAAGVPVFAMLAFEVLLAEIRRRVLRRRGQPGPVAITYPRLIRLVLAPWPTFVAWRRLVLEATDPAAAFVGVRPAVRVRATVAARMPDPAPVGSGPIRQAIADRPASTDPQTPAVERTPRPVRRPAAARAGLVRPPVTARVGGTDQDAADLAKLRQWQDDNEGQTLSLGQIEKVLDCGRSKAIRLRDRLAAEDADRAAV
ncbi:DUF2637 domain-containing protein [Micromonospora sp. NPDC051006]|uniref:DUF2637 domain-containing protein n=1 Tax=Micromonospora sp. NPDC051006 TaxID=3364283 RepID=UPI0037B74E04